jgi:hypothetical protein
MRLIDADEYIEKLRDRIRIEPTWDHSGLRIAIFELNKMPTAERVGKWKYETMRHIITGEMRTVRICSECGGGWFRYDLSDGVEDSEPNYCPNCGARMREDGEDDE